MENDLKKYFHSTLAEGEEGISVISLVDGFSTCQVNISTKSPFLSLIIGRTKIFCKSQNLCKKVHCTIVMR